jgi:hypothetical protein
MTAHVVSNGPTHLARATTRPRVPLTLSRSELLRLTLALGCALTGTALGAAMAFVVIALVVARRSAVRALERSAAVRRGVLAPSQHARPLHAAGDRSEAVARP